MRLFPSTPREQNTFGMRVLGLCIVAALAISFFGRVAKYRESAGNFEFYYFSSWQVIGLQVASLLALVMLGWSSIVGFGEARFRDRRYGIAGVILALSTLAMWLLPAPPKIR